MTSSIVCVDANIIVRLVSPRPNRDVEAYRQEWRSVGKALVAPTVLGYEVVNSIHRMRLLGNVGDDLAKELLATAMGIPITFYDNDMMFTGGLHVMWSNKSFVRALQPPKNRHSELVEESPGEAGAPGREGCWCHMTSHVRCSRLIGVLATPLRVGFIGLRPPNDAVFGVRNVLTFHLLDHMTPCPPFTQRQGRHGVDPYANPERFKRIPYKQQAAGARCSGLLLF